MLFGIPELRNQESAGVAHRLVVFTSTDKSFIKKETPCSPKTELRV